MALRTNKTQSEEAYAMVAVRKDIGALSTETSGATSETFRSVSRQDQRQEPCAVVPLARI